MTKSYTITLSNPMAASDTDTNTGLESMFTGIGIGIGIGPGTGTGPFIDQINRIFWRTVEAISRFISLLVQYLHLDPNTGTVEKRRILENGDEIYLGLAFTLFILLVR